MNRADLVPSQEVPAGETLTIEQWAVRYEDDGQVVQVGSPDQARAAAAHPDDPCVPVSRTVTITATEWAEKR